MEKKDLQGNISGKMEVMLRKRPGSARVGYALKVPRMPVRRKSAYRGSCLSVIYERNCLWGDEAYALELDTQGRNVDGEVYL